MKDFYVEQKEQHNFVPDEAEEITLSMWDVSPRTDQIGVNLRKPKADMIGVFMLSLMNVCSTLQGFCRHLCSCLQHCQCKTWQVVPGI